MDFSVVGLDGSLRNLGVVWCDADGKVRVHCTISPPKKQTALLRCEFLYRGVFEVLRMIPVGEVPVFAMEALAYGASGRLGELGGAHYVVQLAVLHWMYERGLKGEIWSYTSSHIRKCVLGGLPPKGREVKGWIEYRMKGLGIPTLETDHENDALLVALCCAVEHGKRLACGEGMPLFVKPVAFKISAKDSEGREGRKVQSIARSASVRDGGVARDGANGRSLLFLKPVKGTSKTG